MDGYEVVAVIRNSASAVRRKGILVIELNGNAMKTVRYHCLAAGVNGHLQTFYPRPDT